MNKKKEAHSCTPITVHLGITHPTPKINQTVLLPTHTSNNNSYALSLKVGYLAPNKNDTHTLDFKIHATRETSLHPCNKVGY